MLIDFRELFPRWGIKPKGVLHCGANVGEEVPVYDELGIESGLFIEANPEIYLKLEDNLLPFYNKGRDYIAEAYCVGDVEGESVIFHISNNGSQSSSILELGTHRTVHPEVYYIKEMRMMTTRIDTHLPPDHGYDFLNIDLQGAELKALKGMGKLLNDFKWAYIEVNKEELYKGCALVGEIDEYLAGFGFKRVETKWAGNTGWGDACFIKQ